MRRIFAAAVTLAALTPSAYAQMGNMDAKTPLQLQYERERKDQEVNAKAYEEHMKRQKTQPQANVKSDPWAGVRPATDAKR